MAHCWGVTTLLPRLQSLCCFRETAATVSHSSAALNSLQAQPCMEGSPALQRTRCQAQGLGHSCHLCHRGTQRCKTRGHRVEHHKGGAFWVPKGCSTPTCLATAIQPLQEYSRYTCAPWGCHDCDQQHHHHCGILHHLL